MRELSNSIITIIREAAQLSKPRKKFFTHVLSLFLSISGRVNFLQLARYSNKYIESSFRLHFEEYFDFPRFNKELILQHGSGHYVLAFDPTYIRKSGKATPGAGKYWSSCAQKSLWGLEAGLLSVIDVDYHTAYHLDVVQTPSLAERQDKAINLMDHYGQAILWSKEHGEALSAYIAVDAYFAKAGFINRILKQSKLHIISRLRADADLRYLYKGPRKKGRGAPRKYDGKIDVDKPDLDHFELAYQDEEIRIYSAVVNCKFLKRNIRLAYTQFLDEKGEVKNYKLFFSTDIDLQAAMIVKYYRGRFQQEFLIRDGKQFTGLNDCQARSTAKMEFHWNTSLTAINTAKVEHWLSRPAENRKAFSMATVKTLHHNQLLIERFFDILPENTKLSKNNPKILELYQLGALAA
jgi:hypothetical protein